MFVGRSWWTIRLAFTTSEEGRIEDYSAYGCCWWGRRSRTCRGQSRNGSLPHTVLVNRSLSCTQPSQMAMGVADTGITVWLRDASPATDLRDPISGLYKL